MAALKAAELPLQSSSGDEPLIFDVGGKVEELDSGLGRTSLVVVVVVRGN